MSLKRNFKDPQSDREEQNDGSESLKEINDGHSLLTNIMSVFGHLWPVFLFRFLWGSLRKVAIAPTVIGDRRRAEEVAGVAFLYPLLEIAL